MAQTQKTDVMAFIVELLRRFSLKSPKFFQVLQTISIIAGLITGLPEFIDLLNSMGANINLPEIWLAVQSKVIMWASIVLWMAAKLPVENPEQPKTGDGKLVARTKALPFTTKKD